jgi:hypothetical protein
VLRSTRLRERVDALALSPERAGGFTARVLRPLLRWVGYAPRFETSALTRLLDEAERERVDARALELAYAELEANTTRAERTADRLPAAHAAWLARVLGTLDRVRRLADQPSGAKALAGYDRAQLLLPLVLSEAATAPNRASREPAARGPAPPEATAASDEAEQQDATRRLLELQLAAIDRVMDAARDEIDNLERRRRLLEGARRLLLDTSAALPTDGEGRRAREQAIARGIILVDRAEAAGLSARVGLAHQAKLALRRGDRERLHAALLALDGFARGRGDDSRLPLLERALERLAGGAAPAAPRLQRERGLEKLLGARVLTAVKGSLERGRQRYEAERQSRDADRELVRLALDYLAPGSDEPLGHALASVDGCFEVGAALSPTRVVELERHVRLVPYPTRELLLDRARGPEDLQGAVMTDPRSLLLDLAAGKLLTRRYVEHASRPVARKRLVGEARVYLLDASTSMLDGAPEGVRARVRDAILLAELATTLRRLEEPGREVRLSLHYRWFTKRLGPIQSVRTSGEALAALGEVMSTVRKGGTDIEAALISSFELIREAKDRDPDLGRASIVLVTDGEAPVDAERVLEARERVGDVAIAVSVIALGEENPALRELVARQRARGERVFYRHAADPELAAICRGELGDFGLFAPPEGGASIATLRDELEHTLDELGSIERGDRRRVRRAAAESATLSPCGRRALEEAATRDQRSLDKRLDRWFPDPGIGEPPSDGAPPRGEVAGQLPAAERRDLDAMRIVLATVVEVVGDLGAEPSLRAADALDLLERLLVDARLTPARYDELVRRHTRRLARELAAVRACIRGPASAFEHRLAQHTQARAEDPEKHGGRRRVAPLR